MTGAHAPAPAHFPQRVAWGRLVWGTALLGAGVLWLLDASGAPVAYPRVIAIALIGLGVVVPFVPEREHGGVVGLGLVLIVLALVTALAGSAIDPTVLRQSVGDVNVAPVSAAQVRPTYEHGAGDLNVDLRRVVFPTGVTTMRIQLGAGQLRVRLPDDVSARVKASSEVGDVIVLSQKRSGFGPSFDGNVKGRSSERVLDLTIAVGAGRIEVTR